MANYGISTALLKEYPLEEVIAKIAEAGFKEIEISGDDAHYNAWFQDTTAARKALQRTGITPTSVHSPHAGWHNAASDPLVRQTALETNTACFFQAAEIGARMVVVHPNSSSDPFTPDTYATSWARTRDTLVILAERAQEAGIKMLLENMPARGLPRPGSTIIDVLKFIDGLGDHVGVCLDVGHSYANGIDPAEEMRQAEEKLLEVHLQDNDGSGEDQHWIMGAGGIDWDAYHETVAEMAFEGFELFEVLRGDTPEALMTQMARLRETWERKRS